MTRSLRTLSTKEFRHFAKEFFPRWVGSCGCPVLRMGLSYNKRKNMVELAVLRGCTATPDAIASVPNGNPDTETRESGVGWPGMMSIRVHELDGMYDHPILPMAGDTWQLLEIQCHSKLAARRIQKPKKGSKPDGSDDNGDTVPTPDMRPNAESPLLWLRADPEMEYLAEIHFNQSVQMWINQLEKDKDVVAQAQAIATLEALPHLSFAVVNALNNFLGDSKAFWRVRIEAAFALAHTASEDTDWAGLLHLVKFYKSRRFDADIGLPRPNDFHDFPEYFVLEAIPHAIAMVRATDKKSPREAVEFVLQLLKYNDNNGNPYSDVYWLAALVQSVGALEFGQQVKLAVHAMRLCQLRYGSDSEDDIKGPTLLALLRLLESRKAFNNVFLRHQLFCILQILSGRRPTLLGVPKIHIHPMGDSETCSEQKNKPTGPVKLRISRPQEPLTDAPNHLPQIIPTVSASKEADTVSNGSERKMPVVKIRVKQSAASSRAEETDHIVFDRSQGGQHEAPERGASSSMSVDAPPRINTEPVSTSNQNLEEVNSCHDCGSRMTASIGSAKLANDEDEVRKELQCTADSGKAVAAAAAQPQPEDRSSPSIKGSEGETDAKKYVSLQTLSVGRYDHEVPPPSATEEPHLSEKEKEKKKKKKKDKDKKRKREDKEDHKGQRDDPEYLERKRQKKEKKQKEKEMAKLQSGSAEASSVDMRSIKEETPRVKSASVELKPSESSGSKVVIKSVETKGGDGAEGSSVQKLRIKFKSRSLNKS